jgi:SAM-dependent methyltransferase
MMKPLSKPARRCLSCNAVEPIAANEPVWPLGWRCACCGQLVAQSDGISVFAPELADTIDGFDPTAFDMLSEAEARHFWFVTRNELIVGLIDKFFPGARRFLEVGCGNGAVLRAVAASRSWERLVGSELHPSGLSRARERLPDAVEFAQMDARQIPAVEAFDLTGAFDVIEHIADDEAVLRGLRAATQTGGGTIIAVPQHPWLWSHIDEYAHHQRRYQRGELETKLRRSGFEVVFSSSFTALLLPIMAASRLKGWSSDNADIDRELTINPRTNALLIAILRAEVRMTLAGLNWPAGGSRVVVGRAI